MPPTPRRLPLSTLLAQVLVAYTVEFDNLSELALPHHTTDGDAGTVAPDGGSRPNTPWLVSYVCWANVLQYIGPDGLTVATLRERARTTHLLLEGLRRWRYVRLIPAAGQELKKPIAATTLVRTTRHGRLAQDVWRSLPAAMDERWRTHLGDDTVDRLHHALATLFVRLPINPPAYLPVVYPTQNGRAESAPPGPPSHHVDRRTTDLVTLLAGVLLAFTLDFEAESKLALAISANTLRVLSADSTRVRDLPRLTGISKEGNAMCAGFLVRRGCAVIEADPAASRGKVIRLTDKGVKARTNAGRNLATTEERWRTTFGAATIDALRSALEPLVGDGTIASSPLAAGLVPDAANWRASVRPPETLPHYPMVLHRGGFPDGS